MSATELKRWMDTNGVRAVDIASALKISEDTVKRFLAGTTRPHLSTIASIERFVSERSAKSPERKTALG
jgi:predicted transcriptional regulator